MPPEPLTPALLPGKKDAGCVKVSITALPVTLNFDPVTEPHPENEGPVRKMTWAASCAVANAVPKATTCDDVAVHHVVAAMRYADVIGSVALDGVVRGGLDVRIAFNVHVLAAS